MSALDRSAVGLVVALTFVLGAPVVAQADELPAPAVITLAATDITETTATFHATVATNSTATTGHFVYGKSLHQLTQRTAVALFSAGPGQVALDAQVSGLEPDSKYYFMAVVENDDWTVTGDKLPFSTPRPPVPAILGWSVSDITYKSATLHLNVVTRGQTVMLGGCTKSGSRLAVRSLCVNSSTGGVVTPFGPFSVAADGDIAIPVSGLEPGTNYAWSATVTNVLGSGTSRGAFRTESLIVMPKPTLTPAVATYGDYVTVSGTIPNKPGLVLTLAEQVYPFHGLIAPLAKTTDTTDTTGAYEFDIIAERPAAYGVTADGAVALAARNVTKLKVAPAVTAKAKRARRHRFVVAGRYQPAIASNVSLYRRGAGRVGDVRASKGTFRFPARVLKPGKYEIRVTPAVSTGFERAKSAAITIPRR
jgi:hypothetical protein